MKNSVRLIFVLLAASCISSCGKKTSSSSDDQTQTAPTTTTGQSAAQLAGAGDFCATEADIGTLLGTMGTIHYLQLNANGTYTYQVFFSDHTACATSQASGGNNIATYVQTGTFVAVGAAVSPTTATQIVFTVTNATMTIRPLNGDGSTNNYAVSFAFWMNNGCSPSPGFSSTANSTKTVLGNTCVGNGDFNQVVLPNVPDAINNVMQNNGSTLSAGSRVDIWRPGILGTYPSTMTETYIGW